MPFDMFPNIDRVRNINNCKIFVVHGTRDEVVPFQHGEDIFTNCIPEMRVKPFWVEGGGHNDLETFFR